MTKDDLTVYARYLNLLARHARAAKLMLRAVLRRPCIITCSEMRISSTVLVTNNMQKLDKPPVQVRKTV